MKTIAFFNNKGGVGKTTLVYHVAHMMAALGVNVLAVDLDPQANLTSMCMDETELEKIWPFGPHPETIYGALRPIISGTGDVEQPRVFEIAERFTLIAGDLGLSNFEDKLSDSWARCHNRDESAFRAMTAFYRGFTARAEESKADFILVDVGPNLGAINRSALIACDYVVVPLGPDLFSVQGLRNLGPALREWRYAWKELIPKCPANDLKLPLGTLFPLGYVVLQHGMRGNAPLQAYQRWINRFPQEYRTAVLDENEGQPDEPDTNRLALLKHYRSLMPMAMEARKPVFFLKPADGAIGAHFQAAQSAFDDFAALAREIAARAGSPIP